MEEFDFKTGMVILNDFDFIKSLEPGEQPEDKLWSFKHDIIQVKYKKGIVLDLGWLPEFDLEKGKFKLVIIKERNWETPIFLKRTKSIKKICEYITEAIEVAVNNER